MGKIPHILVVGSIMMDLVAVSYTHLAVNTVMDDEVKAVLEANAEENGFKIIAWTDIGSRSVLNQKHAVNTVDDLKGLKLRCTEAAVLADTRCV